VDCSFRLSWIAVSTRWWCCGRSLQKVGASAAVFLGVTRGVFAAVALVVAGFDLLSGILGLALWNRVRR
jgi:hypothetical protein